MSNPIRCTCGDPACPSCGTVHGLRPALPRPEIDVCSACGENTVYVWDSTEGWLSECCAAQPIKVDREPEDAGAEQWFQEDR